jgi:hypothetical protein
VIIDERGIKGDPYAKLKYALNNGIRKEFGVTRDVVTKVEPLDSMKSDLLQAADVLMGAIGYHCQEFHLRPDAKKEKVELARYIAFKFALRDLTLETHPLKENLKIVRWYWKGQPKQRYRRRAADNPRPVNRRAIPGK